MRQKEIIRLMPQQPQRQDGLRDQMQTVIAAATRLGCYDAADYMLDLLNSNRFTVTAAEYEETLNRENGGNDH